MDIALAVENILPAAEYFGSVADDTEETWNLVDWKDTRRGKPTWGEVVAAAPDPLEEARAAQKAAAQAEAATILTARMQAQLAQAETFTAAEFALFATAGLFKAWVSEAGYAARERIAHEGIVYETLIAHTSQAHQPPGSEGMLAVYRPLSVDAETGEEADGSMESPVPFRTGMDVTRGKYYTWQGGIYLALQDAMPCLWEPQTAPALFQAV